MPQSGVSGKDDPYFAQRIQHIAQRISYGQDTSEFNQLEVAAATIYLKDQDLPGSGRDQLP